MVDRNVKEQFFISGIGKFQDIIAPNSSSVADLQFAIEGVKRQNFKVNRDHGPLVIVLLPRNFYLQRIRLGQSIGIRRRLDNQNTLKGAIPAWILMGK
jgi:hypothetical protein